MIKYKTSKWGERITKVEIVRETDKFVYEKVNETRIDRSAKSSGYASYFDTYAEAKAFLIEEAQRMVNMYKDQLHRAKSDLGMLESLQEKI